MRSERVVVRVVVLEGKAPAVQMKQFTHLSVLKSPVLVRCGTHPACLGCTRPPDEPLSFRTVCLGVTLGGGHAAYFLGGRKNQATVFAIHWSISTQDPVLQVLELGAVIVAVIVV